MAGCLALAGRYVLVTGASSGLGREIARTIARDYHGHVIAVARRADRLAELARELSERWGATMVPITADLTRGQDVERVFVEATAGRSVYGVILNAGVTFYGEALSQNAASVETLLATNTMAPVRLAQLFGRHLVERNEGGGMLLVASMAGLVPMPYQAVYGGTKALLASFGLALREELRRSGVSVSIFAPGGIATEMLDLSGLSAKFAPDGIGMMSADVCATAAVRAFVTRRALVVPGAMNRLTAWLMNCLPLSWVVPVVARLYRQPETAKGAGR
jgi:short-subunit dehydrogenase